MIFAIGPFWMPKRRVLSALAESNAVAASGLILPAADLISPVRLEYNALSCCWVMSLVIFGLVIASPIADRICCAPDQVGVPPRSNEVSSALASFFGSLGLRASSTG
jgi:hypothetical protein